MRFTLIGALSCAAILGFASCSNEENPISNLEDANEIIPQEYLNIKYDGKTYTDVPTSYDENGEFVFLDGEFSEIYNTELKGNETLSIHFVDDSTIEMYQDLKSNLANHGIDIAEVPADCSTRTIIPSDDGSILGKVEMYDDKKFKDRMIDFGITNPQKSVYQSELKTYGFNDKCSSAKLTCALSNSSSEELDMGSYKLKYSQADLVFIGYEDSNYGKNTYTIIATPDARTQEVKEFKGFNDKISSIKLFFYQTGTYTSGLRKY